jgi:hypothetical protein
MDEVMNSIETFHLYSKDPKNYNTVIYGTQIEDRENKDIYYRIRNFTTFGNSTVLNTDDYMTIEYRAQISEFEYDWGIFPYAFVDHGPFDHDSLADYIQNIMGLEGKINDRGLIEFRKYRNVVVQDPDGLEGETIVIKEPDVWYISEMSHRARLCFGFYHAKFPIESVNGCIKSPSIPFYNYSNVLYLMSNVGKLVGTNIVFDERRQIAYKSIEFMRLELPLICDKRGDWIKISANNFTHLEFVLCDFMFEPIIIHAPIHITLEIMYKDSPIRYVVNEDSDQREPNASEPK